MLSDQQYTAYIGARRRSDLIGEFKEPFNKFCANLDHHEISPCTDNEFFHLAEVTKETTDLPDWELDEIIQTKLAELASLLTEQQTREIKTIQQYYKSL